MEFDFNFGTLAVALSVALLVIIILRTGLKIIKQSQVVVIERLGKYHSTLDSGINIIWPILDVPRKINWFNDSGLSRGSAEFGIEYTKVDRIDLRETVFDFPKQSVITKDNVNVEINALLYFQIMDPVRAVYEIEDLPLAIEKLTQTTLRNIIGELELDQTLSSRDTINSRLQIILDDATNKWGVKVNRVELQDIHPPHEIQEAMNKQMMAERERRARVLEAEGLKTASILKSEGQKESEINLAEAEKKSEILKAEGKANAKIKLAEAEKESIELITTSIDKKSDPVKYLIAMKYIETLEKMVEGDDNKVVYMPYEATAALGSLGGIKEILK
jgi:regulator of protease activity HflC (stomatin/prohibitin superfamily)